MPIHLSAPDLEAVSRRFGSDMQVVSAVRDASAQTGTPFETLLASAAIESGLQPKAQAATSSASGLFQFTTQTWLRTLRQFGAAHGLQAEAASVVQRGGQLTVEDPAAKQRILDMRLDPVIASQLAGEHMRALADQLTTSVGHAPDAGELYLGHFLGGGGAAQILRAAQATPSRPAADVLPSAAAANQSMFYAKDGTPFTVTQFVQNVRGRVARAFTEVGASMPQGPVTLSGSPTPGRSADPPDAGASGWGISTPRQIATLPGRSMSAVLAEVFLRTTGDVARSRNPSNRHDQSLPQAILSALQPG